MKKTVIIGALVITLGILISFGPKSLFKVCSPIVMATELSTDDCGDDGSCGCSGNSLSFPICHWSARAEIGIGFLIVALGVCLMFFLDLRTQQGLTIGIFLASITALSIPHVLIGGCNIMTMACRRIAFPVLSIICIITLIGSVIIFIYIEGKMKRQTIEN
jgi:hypothetical protein